MHDNRVTGLHNFPVRLGRELGILAFIFALALAIRFPFFFPAVIDWDESTFIIIGQSTVDGFLPNEIAWDVKPPFVFWWFGAAIELFGHSIPAVRFAGFLWLVLSAYLLFQAAFFSNPQHAR
jgi:4-amino-4-deoxy-L-arabinose transferase-like glycosyltransferase